jgi:histidinol-phosphate aminotransferase
MPVFKQHLADLYRVNPHDKTRKGFLRLDMNEGVPGLCEDFVGKVVSSIDSQFLATYPEYKPLQELVAARNGLETSNILLSNGSDAAIKYIFDTYVAPRDRVLLTDPSFAMYPVYCRMFDAEALSIKYREDLTFPLGEFLDKISANIRLAVVVNPNNPTGHALTQDELREIITAAAAHDVLLLVDEAYYYFYPETVIGWVKEYQHLIVLRTFSKLCGMATVRLGYAAACPEIIQNLIKVRPTYDVNGIAVLFGEKILENPKIIEDLIKETNAGKEYLLRKLAESRIQHHAGQANFVLIKCQGKAPYLTRRLAQEKILVSSGFRNGFLQDYMRVTIGNRAVMERFWEAFQRVWEAAHV